MTDEQFEALRIWVEAIAARVKAGADRDDLSWFDVEEQVAESAAYKAFVEGDPS